MDSGYVTHTVTKNIFDLSVEGYKSVTITVEAYFHSDGIDLESVKYSEPLYISKEEERRVEEELVDEIAVAHS
jgi:hypothetical protein